MFQSRISKALALLCLSETVALPLSIVQSRREIDVQGGIHFSGPFSLEVDTSEGYRHKDASVTVAVDGYIMTSTDSPQVAHDFQHSLASLNTTRDSRPLIHPNGVPKEPHASYDDGHPASFDEKDSRLLIHPNGGPKERADRFKLIASVEEGPWLVQKKDEKDFRPLIHPNGGPEESHAFYDDGHQASFNEKEGSWLVRHAEKQGVRDIMPQWALFSCGAVALLGVILCFFKILPGLRDSPADDDNDKNKAAPNSTAQLQPPATGFMSPQVQYDPSMSASAVGYQQGWQQASQQPYQQQAW